MTRKKRRIARDTAPDAPTTGPVTSSNGTSSWNPSIAAAVRTLVTDGALVGTWQDPRVLAVAAATAYFWWQRGIFGTIVVGTTVMLAARLGLGW